MPLKKSLKYTTLEVHKNNKKKILKILGLKSGYELKTIFLTFCSFSLYGKRSLYVFFCSSGVLFLYSLKHKTKISITSQFFDTNT